MHKLWMQRAAFVIGFFVVAACSGGKTPPMQGKPPLYRDVLRARTNASGSGAVEGNAKMVDGCTHGDCTTDPPGGTTGGGGGGGDEGSLHIPPCCMQYCDPKQNDPELKCYKCAKHNEWKPDDQCVVYPAP